MKKGTMTSLINLSKADKTKTAMLSAEPLKTPQITKESKRSSWTTGLSNQGVHGQCRPHNSWKIQSPSAKPQDEPIEDNPSHPRRPRRPRRTRKTRSSWTRPRCTGPNNPRPKPRPEIPIQRCHIRTWHCIRTRDKATPREPSKRVIH